MEEEYHCQKCGAWIFVVIDDTRSIKSAHCINCGTEMEFQESRRITPDIQDQPKGRLPGV